MNLVILMGRLTRDPEVRYATNNMAVAKFSLAVDRRTQDNKTDFFNCTAFGKTAEGIEKYVHKGVKIIVQGSVNINEYMDKDNNKKYATEIVVNTWEFAESKSASQQNATAAATTNAGEGFMDIVDDAEMPFT